MSSGRLPELYSRLSAEQQKGETHILPGLPAVVWHADLAGGRARAETLEVYTAFRFPPKGKQQPTWAMLLVWRRLARLGFVAVEVKPMHYTMEGYSDARRNVFAR